MSGRLQPSSAQAGRGGMLGACMLACLLVLAIVAPRAAAQAGDGAPLVFADAAEEARFHALAVRLRCVMCQNQSLADSNARIAQDLRRELLALIRDGRSDAEIEQFLVDRYGEFVLYKPRMSAQTVLLWFAPLLVVAAGAAVLVVVVRRRSRTAVPLPPDDGRDW